MVGYRRYQELAGSGNSEERGQAAHLVATAFVTHKGTAEERAALYAAVMGFLDDSSVKVRAALAYGLLHADCAPRPVMVSLLNDAPVIARAVAQYSPVLVDADLLTVIETASEPMLDVIALRKGLNVRLSRALIARGIKAITLTVVSRSDINLDADLLTRLAAEKGEDAEIRGALLARKDLPALTRYELIERVREVLSGARIVKGAVAPQRLKRLFRDSMDKALSSIGERESAEGRDEFARAMVSSDRISTRMLLHALVNGQVLFFAECIGQIAELPAAKVFGLLDRGSRVALHALFSRCGLAESVRNLLARLVVHARAVDLARDLSARHYIVTTMVAELIDEDNGHISPALEECFAYLNQQNIVLARQAARGIRPALALADHGRLRLSPPDVGERLPAA
jgi:uncharacterized protein (DUF2336 family)